MMGNNTFRWVYLAHLGYNMWLEPKVDSFGIHGQEGWSDNVNARDMLRFDEDFWRDLTLQLKEAGCNTILLDIGEGVRYDSHPELAIKGSWSKAKLSDELSRLRGMGFEVLPKLNFSACHDYWLGEYARMLSTSVYYRVVSDVVTEIAELFDHPALFHLGMDEETAENQRLFNYMVVRQGEQWWYDFKKLIAVTESAGCRPWIWSDYAWNNEEVFFRNMSKEVVQSNWYYGTFQTPSVEFALYDKLNARGFDQIPTGSTWNYPDNMERTVKYCKPILDKNLLLGYMQTPWEPTLLYKKDKHDASIKDMINAIDANK